MNKYTEYEKLSDEELVEKYHAGDNESAEYLMEKYKNFVRMKARAYFLAGADNDDLIQEGMIGLYKAVRDYKFDKSTLFMTFASICVSRQIRTAVTTYNRKKNTPLNSYISLDTPVKDEMGDSATLSDVITSSLDKSPEDLIMGREENRQLMEAIFHNLSKMEKNVLELYVEGLSYAEIGEHMEKSPKSIDNAIQRIRNKINEFKGD